MRRYARRLAVGAALASIAALALGYVRFERARRGPPLPVCGAAPLARGAFGSPRRLTNRESAGSYGNEPGAALLPSGRLALIYQAQSGLFSPNGLGLVTLDTDGRLESGTLSTESVRHFDPWMTAGPDGTLHAVWLEHDGGLRERHSRIRYASSLDGLSWRVGDAVDDAATDCPHDMPGCLDKPMIAWAGDAALVLYYSEAVEAMKAVRVVGGKVVAPSARVGSGAYGDVAATPSGVVHVTYVTGDEARVDRFGDRRIFVEVVRSDDAGRSFGRPTRVSRDDEPIPFFFSNPQVAFDERRSLLYVVYPTGASDGRWSLVLATSGDLGATWRRVRINDDAPCATHMTPKSVLDPTTGVLHVIWLENRSGEGAVAYASCSPGGERCGTNEAVSSEPFASFTFARHRSDWLGEYPALVLDSPRRTLHAVWAQPVAEDGNAVSRLFHARAELGR